ncbi:MAG: 16S rRNA (cytidine(1402)-2'-O)-methyltransferase [Candidatus Dojkabacteria bacterium]|nr:16S rRNA (cytidine(1402)-2'-O)-methyltransferase [Candidatus Dojkabacteria bacterium]
MNLSQPGKLYVVATPIGNLEDITFRAVRILKEVSIILAEDTRKTTTLLHHYNIDTKMLSYRDQNHLRVIDLILGILESGQNIALVSDSGTPLISDPGFKLVRELVAQNINVIAIPGPSAVIAALSVSGLPTDKFTFLGFLPKGPGRRKTALEKFGNLDTTLIIYESPFRLKSLLDTIYETFGDRTVTVANDLTKKFERVWCGKISAVQTSLEGITPKGEFVILISKE